MGTLTAQTPTHPDHCPHKLPTSCRLTATPACCACQDRRPHSRYYSTYVDGVGLVNRGVRWQRYCYFCRVFWENRVAASSVTDGVEGAGTAIEAADTRVPEVPSQEPFLARWFEYYRGFRTEVRGERGREEKIEVRKEKEWRDTDPGTLPVLNESERRMAGLVRRRREQQEEAEGQVSLDETLEGLMGEVDDDEEEEEERVDGWERRERTAADREAEARRREEADERAMNEALEKLQEADRRLGTATLRKQRAACEMEAAERELRTRQNERRAALRDHQGSQYLYQMLHREQQELNTGAAQRFARVFGSREDIERQGSEYVSPLTTMFTRAYERHRIAEEVRAQERASDQNSNRHREFLTNMTEEQYPALFNAIQEQVEREAIEQEREAERKQLPKRTLDDERDARPPPKSDEELTLKLQCRVCLQQIADTACLPCGHLVMCVHCANICVPTRDGDKTAPVRKSTCPLCRKGVSRRVRIFTS